LAESKITAREGDVAGLVLLLALVGKALIGEAANAETTSR
jgi:hypothetical protein